MLKKIWTLSNFLSFSRILLVVPIAFLLLSDHPEKRTWVAALVLIGVATDFLDGYLARALHQVTDLGKVIDPLADKIAVGSVAVLLLWTGQLPMWYVLTVLVRDALIVLGGLYIKRRKNIIAQSNWPGKLAVTALALVLLLTVLEEPGLERYRTAAIWFSVGLMVLSLVSYVQRLFIGSTAGIRERA